ncbi:MAG: universal stress protein [Candidatus Rokuibacteriota bacterium]
MISRILHPSDFSSASRPAFKKALELAKANGATLDILHVLSPAVPMPGDGYVSPTVYDRIVASAMAWARKQMDALVKKARAAGVKTAGTVVEGVAADRIVKAARARRASMVVMGTHGRTGLSRFLLGSVASRVISTAPCPVLTVRGK